MEKNKYTRTAEILLYTLADAKVYAEFYLHNGDMWLSKEKIIVLFAVSAEDLTAHLKEIFLDEEVNPTEASAGLVLMGDDGEPVDSEYYNLDTILALAFRLQSPQAVQFRKWARLHIREFIVKGFIMDDERLKNPNRQHGEDYFKEQIDRIRDIRSSERSFFQKITDVFIQCSGDYDASTALSREFFSTIQNKIYWAICKQTPAEIIVARADSSIEQMGLSSWKLYPNGEIRESDVLEAKNYLSTEEVQALNRIVSMYLDFATLQADYRKIMYMSEWQHKLDTFIEFNKYEMFNHTGRINQEVANSYALAEYKKYKTVVQKSYQSDYDKFLNRLSLD